MAIIPVHKTPSISTPAREPRNDKDLHAPPNIQPIPIVPGTYPRITVQMAKRYRQNVRVTYLWPEGTYPRL